MLQFHLRDCLNILAGKTIFNFQPMRSCTSTISSKSIVRILGIETSCDDTGAAIVDSTGHIVSQSVHSQQEWHNRLGGICPPIAGRMHEANIDQVVTDCLQKSGLQFADIDAIAVTTRPGLVLSLLVGTNFALNLCKEHCKPLIPVHHMKAHALTVRLSENVQFPFLCLLVSGGHCILTFVRGIDDFVILGQSTDDAPGEVFDKIARRLKLKNISRYFQKMSGGQAMETLAAQSKNPEAHLAFKYVLPMIKHPDCRFSFAGIKSQSTRYIDEAEANQNTEAGDIMQGVEELCASVQHVIFKHLAKRVQRAIEFLDERELMPPEDVEGGCTPVSQGSRIFVLSGGVACNSYIRKGLAHTVSQYGYRLVCPPPKLCSDNGVMIAWNGLELFHKNLGGIIPPEKLPESIWAEAKEPIGEDWSQEISALGRKVRKKVKLDNPSLFL